MRSVSVGSEVKAEVKNPVYIVSLECDSSAVLEKKTL